MSQLPALQQQLTEGAKGSLLDPLHEGAHKGRREKRKQDSPPVDDGGRKAPGTTAGFLRQLPELPQEPGVQPVEGDGVAAGGQGMQLAPGSSLATPAQVCAM